MDATSRRRWVGGVALSSAVALLVAGETLFKGSLSPAVWIAYYLVCFLLTGIAVLVALFDARAAARKCINEQRELFDATLKRIETDATRARERVKSSRVDGE